MHIFSCNKDDKISLLTSVSLECAPLALRSGDSAALQLRKRDLVAAVPQARRQARAAARQRRRRL